MARPKKQVVDYFPHYCIHKKTMFIIENKYGNDGYACWFKILELLGQSEGHVYDCNKPDDWEFLLAKTRLNEQTANDILQTLSNLEAIDPDLWAQRVIWSDNFIANIADAYKRRSGLLPQKPHKCRHKPSDNGIYGDKNPQRRVEESILDNNTYCSEVSPIPSEQQQPVLKIPLIPKDGEFLVFQSDIDQWQETFPGVDVLQGLRECRQWNMDNPTRRKTKTGIRRHVSTWLAKEQNKAKGGKQAQLIPGTDWKSNLGEVL